MPNGDHETSSDIAELNLPSLPASARIAHIFKKFPGSLLSIGTFCDNGMRAVYDRDSVTIEDSSGNVVLRGNRDFNTKLWMINLDPAEQPSPTILTASQVVHHESNAARVAYYHACLGSPAVSTFIAAAENDQLRSFPGLTAAMIRKNMPNPIATAQGHLKQSRQHYNSTKHRETPQQYERHQGPRTQHIVTTVVPVTNTHFSDDTGRFPITSRRGNQYVLLSYFPDKNYIHVTPHARRTGASILDAYKQDRAFWSSKNIHPQYYALDNEASAELKAYFLNEVHVSYQLFPEGQHRANPAERAIQTFKDHFIALLCTAAADYPLSEWDLLLEHAELTLALLHASRCNPHISAWEDVHGSFDYTRTPLAPAGTLVLAHEKADKRDSWSVHGLKGYYVGTSLEHHRCYNVFIPEMRSIRIPDTVHWFPAVVHMPGSSPSECLTAALQDISVALRVFSSSLDPAQKQPVDALLPGLLHGLEQLRAIFNESQSSSQQRVPDTTLSPHNPLSTDLVRTARAISDDVQRTRSTRSGDPLPSSVTEGVPPPDIIPATPEPAAVIADSPSTATNIQPVRNSLRNRHAPVRLIAQEAVSQFPRLSSTHGSWKSANLPPTGWTGNLEIDQVLYDSAQDMRHAWRKRVQRTVKEHTWYKKMIATNGSDVPRKQFKRFAAAVTRFVAATAVTLDTNGNPLTYNSAMRGPDKALWEVANSEEFHRLLVTTKTMKFVSSLPKDRTATYFNPQIRVKVKDGMIERRVRGTVGGDKVDYPGEVSAQTAAMTTIKLLLNAVISEDAQWCTADIKDFYLGTPLPRPEYMRINLKHIPLSTQKEHNIYSPDQNGHVLVEINKGMYGLPQAGLIAQQQLNTLLAKHGYHPARHTPCLYKHESRPVTFSLVVDDFGIKYKGEDNLQHLLTSIRELYILKVDPTGGKYVGLTIQFDRKARTCAISMPGYVQKALERFGITKGSSNTNSPAIYTPPKYGQSEQLTVIDDSAPLPADRAKRIQEIVGVFLFYARAVDPTMLTTINKIGSVQSKPTVAVEQAAERFLQYAATWPDAQVVFHASDMRLICHSDASHLSETSSRSRAGGFFFLGNTHDVVVNQVNGGIEFISIIIPTVTGSAAESEYAALFIVGTTAAGLRTALADLGYEQTATPIICDNKCAVGIATNTVKQRRSKAIDMRYHWIQDRIRMGQVTVTWHPGKTNLADFFTKTHSAIHHQECRPIFVKGA
jgi:hypothetical protein